MKIPFDIKYRPQIESGEYKVVTRDGSPVRIVCWDRKSAGDGQPIVALVEKGHYENSIWVEENGVYKGTMGHEYDLFIITPEPELAESEDERIRKEIIEFIQNTIIKRGIKDGNDKAVKWIAYLEKHKENVEKEYVFRPLAGTDITIAAEQAIRRAMEGDHLVLAFNGWYVPVDKYATTKGLVDSYDTFIEKQKEQKPREIEWEDAETLAYIRDILKKYFLRSEEFEDIDRWLTEHYIEQKPEERFAEAREKYQVEWSEEDENTLKYLHELISFGYTEKFFDAQTAADMREWLNTRLKSLRPQWKPSEEQMRCLDMVLCDEAMDENVHRVLVQLREQLKRLKRGCCPYEGY